MGNLYYFCQASLPTGIHHQVQAEHPKNGVNPSEKSPCLTIHHD